MSSLLFLEADDFSIQPSNNGGTVLCHSIPGISLIVFYSTKCQFCQNLIPTFKKLPGTVGGCQFGMINATLHRKILQMCADTISPIKYVPLIILYVNGHPFIRYDGPHDENEIRKFLVEVTSKIHARDKFSSDRVKESGGRDIPAYTVGHPLYGTSDVSYLEFEEAYPS